MKNNTPAEVTVSFYQVTKGEPEQCAARLLEKVIDSAQRALVYTETPEKQDVINGYFWTYSPGSFLPHGAAGEGLEERQPILLSQKLAPLNGAPILVTLDPCPPEGTEQFTKILDIFNGNDPAIVTLAQNRWRAYKKAGYNLRYWYQDDAGKWTEKNLT
jgi:DNA polymerase-3 subunit chi